MERIGNEINHLGITEIEADFTRGASMKTVLRTIAESVLYTVVLSLLMVFIAIAAIAVNG